MTSKYITDLELAELDEMVCIYWQRANHSHALGYLYGLQDGIRSCLLTYSDLDSELSLLLDIVSIREVG